MISPGTDADARVAAACLGRVEGATAGETTGLRGIGTVPYY